MRIGKPYKHTTINDDFDAIVIGSGIGGLTCAHLLSRHASMRVLVLERHYTAGGFTHTFSRPGYEWDVGLHYIGKVHRANSFLRRCFDHLSDGNLEWADMGEVYDTIVIGTDRYEFAKGREVFREHLHRYFPHQSLAIDRYLKCVKDAVAQLNGFFLDKALPLFLSSLIGPLLRRKALAFARLTVKEVLQSVGIESGSRLFGVLSGQYGDYGLPPGQASFFMHAILVDHYMEGAAYPVGGSSRIAQTFIPQIEKSEGMVVTSAEVSSVLMEKNRAVGVVMSDGRQFFAPLVISAAGYATTFSKLILQNKAQEAGLVWPLAGVPASSSHVALYVGVKEDAQALGLRASNIWLYPHEDHDRNVNQFLADRSSPLPLIYFSFPSAKDPSFATRFPGRSTIEAIGLAPCEWFSAWHDKRWKKRGADYETLKEQLTEPLVKALYDQCPQVRGKIDYLEMSTPLSTKHFAGHPHGEIYGLAHVPARFLERRLRPQTPFKGFYLTGADTLVAGVGGALMSGILTASVVIRKNLLPVILAH